MGKLFDLDEMKRRLAEIDAEREPLVRLISAAEHYEGKVGRVLRSSDTLTIREPPHARKIGERREPTVMEITEGVALELIEAHKAPVQTRDVVNILFARGLPVPKKNVINVISARLSNSNALKGRRGVGWWPKDRPWPNDAEIPFESDYKEDEAAGDSLASDPAASVSTPNSADEDGREVAHDNMSH